ncbi:MAG TPA: FMN-binding negative transcriptional regulator, partial [Longimicrobiales bacterium]|nr:FMN-binding negative transcriptional regulator [Longimicrobiales bacterium]
RRNNFGILFSAGPDGPVATHLPFSLDAERGEHGTLVAHMARANPHWKALAPDQEVLVVFAGPHAYISPTWYAEPVAVPTWNYAAVHVYGVPQLVEDMDVLRGQVEQLVHEHEAHRDPAWDVAAAEPKLEGLLKAIVGFEIPIARVEGKMKFNQNRSREDREGVVRALEGEADSMAQAVVEIMRRTME